MKFKPLLIIGIVLSAFASAEVKAVQIYGLTETNDLVSFDTDTPGNLTSVGPIRGAEIVDLDFSPTNGLLYGISSNGNLYFLDVNTADATLAVSPLTALDHITDFDFNPATDRVRVFGKTDRNYSLTPDASAISAPQTGTPGTVVDYGRFTNQSYDLVASAYTNNVNNAASTTLYSIDTSTDGLVIHNGNPALNSVNVVGLLGVNLVTSVGLDIGANGIAYLNQGENLYTVNLDTGHATSIGAVPTNLASIAVVVPEPSSFMLALLPALGLLLRRRRVA